MAGNHDGGETADEVRVGPSCSNRRSSVARHHQVGVRGGSRPLRGCGREGTALRAREQVPTRQSASVLQSGEAERLSKAQLLVLRRKIRRGLARKDWGTNFFWILSSFFS